MWKHFKTSIKTALKAEEFDKQTSITLICPGESTNYEILCDCYELILHTVFAQTIDEAYAKYEQMKNELQKIAECPDDEMREDMICDFVDRWQNVPHPYHGKTPFDDEKVTKLPKLP